MLPLLAAAILQGQTEVQPDWIKKDHVATLAGQSVKYQTVAGLMPIRSRNGDIEGRIYFTSYKRTDLPAGTKRPLTFVFNGGPGSASVWLHLGLAGPKRPKMGSKEGFMPPPPYELVPNDDSLLPESDLVFIDPVGTGYSRAEKPELGARFWSVDGDISSVGEFIRSYLSTENRWLSPVFVMGESYGGIRGSGLANWLHGHGVGLNGLILVSPYIGTLVQDGGKGNDAPYAFNLPTFAVSAWYHKKLPAEMQKKTEAQVYKEAMDFVYDEYLPALERGDNLSPDRRKAVIAKLRRFTGLSETYLDDTNLRISDYNWYKELLRKDRYVMGRYDARFTGIDRVWHTDHPDDDPSYTQVGPAFTSGINDYLANDIGYRTTNRYFILGEGIGRWTYPSGILDQSESLRQALTNNPYTKVLVTMGYYDLACPMGSVDQILDKMELDPRLKGNIVRKRYAAGHMIYLDDACRKQLNQDISAFVRSQTNPTAPIGTVRPKG
ncbi:peptidase S10 [bacterium]|nr:MAG: peptidase S10 [bacterium]